MHKSVCHVHAIAVFLISCFFVDISFAAERNRYEDFDTQLKTSQGVGALGPDLFGDETDPYTGRTDFWVTDVSLPGNSALPVALVRMFKGSDDGVGEHLKWSNFEVPYLSGIFPQGSASRELNGWYSWVRGSYEKRCQNVTPPPEVRQSGGKEGTFMAEEYFHGIRLNLPGGDTQLMLSGLSNPPAPTDGKTYRWATNGNWRFSCVPQLKNGVAGDGFLGRDPSGNKYYFDWLVSGGYAGHIRKLAFAGGETTLGRMEYRLYVTKIEDRFGNWVDYGYQGANLTSITASDGRSLTLAYDADGKRLTSLTDGRRTWSYEYPENGIKLTYPDGSLWSSAVSGDISRIGTSCNGAAPNERYVGAAILTLQHPSGAVGQFSFSNLRRGLSFVKWNSVSGESFCNQDPKDFDGIALKQKTIFGPGVAPVSWSFAYGPANSCYVNTGFVSKDCAVSAPVTRTVEINAPAGDFIRYVYGNKAYETDGMLLRTESGRNGVVLRTVNKTWQVFDGVGLPLNGAGNHFWEQRRRVLKNEAAVQDGVGFHRDINEFDSFLRPKSVSVWSSLGYGRTDALAYLDNSSKWVLGQVATETNQDTGVVVSRVDYDPVNAMPTTIYKFGKLQQTLSYHTDGSVATISDGRSLTTSLSSWKRGSPQTVRYHDGTQKTSVIDDNGWISSVTDESGFTTSYGYDAMGRLANITYPTADSTVWNSVSQSFRQINAPDRGLPPGHWELLRTEGARRTHTYYDAFWRPVMALDYDADDVNRQTQTITRYDAGGRVEFQSYPTKHVGDFRAALPGTTMLYDGLGRMTESRQDSEHGYLYTTTQYLPGFQTRVRNPRGFETTTQYEVYDEPSYEMPRTIVHPEGAITDINRNKFGQTVSLLRRNSDLSIGASRQYVYDPNQQLCKTVEPETGATIMDYDPAGNLAWTASGVSAPDLTQCNRVEAAASGRVVRRTHDARNRLLQLIFPDGNGNQSWTYTPDGLPAQVTTFNKGDGQAVSDTDVINRYTYNKRRLLTSEWFSQPGWYEWASGYGYDGNGNLRWHTYPTGLSLDYAPNALGQPTQVKSQTDTFATGVSYYPNGAVSQFTYGNGLVHRMTQNTRQLPREVNNGASDLIYDYDTNGNPAAIRDVNAVQGVYSGNRDLTYDGLDRLTNAHLHWQLNESYAYDVLDNIKRKSDTGGAVRSYWYDANNRLTNVQNENNVTVDGLGYDVQGNLQNKSGQSYLFDFGNRLRQVVGKETYRYDGYGRRVLGRRQDGTYSLSLYNRMGQLVYDEKHNNPSKATDYLYLGSSLVATRERDWLGSPAKIIYAHTDSLGSPVANTNGAGQIVGRANYEPYGAVILNPAYSGLGFGGHMMDGMTGLTYMQQRYYDAAIGRFLSVDPVTADMKSGSNFNRYWYANNNPYRFTDPDGRRSKEEHDYKRGQRERAKKFDFPIESVAKKGSYPANAQNGQDIQALFAVGYMDGRAARAAANNARVAAKKEGLKGDRNGPWDAVRHCNASCEVARTLSIDDAILLGDIHEAWYPNKADEGHMDMFNNRYGAENSGSDWTCPVMCRSALDAGNLEVLPESRWDKE